MTWYSLINVITLCFLVCNFFIFSSIYDAQQTPFIDEIFHIPQTIRYCEGNFSYWDPKITTPPGLYWIAYLGHKLLLRSTCTTYSLRLMNVIFSSLYLKLIYSILFTIHGKGKEKLTSSVIIWSSVNIAIFPVLYFFSFLYYTDVVSTFFVLLAYKLHLRKQYWMATVIGLCCVAIRQTNVVWIGFFLLDDSISFLLFLFSHKRFSRFLVRKDILGLLKEFKKENTVCQLFNLTSKLLGYIYICCFFIAFLYWNRGIVLGDKTAHEPVIHLCQLFYYSIFVLFFSLPYYVWTVKKFVKNLFVYFKTNLIISMLMIIVVKCNSLTHIYLLSDNRHYTFYIWKRIYERNALFRYTLVPFYMFAIHGIHQNLLTKTWKYAYWLCVAMCLIPQKLLEFRYFIIPYLIFRVHLKCKTWHLALESILFIIINYMVIFNFKTKEFYWVDSDEVQRILW